MVEYRGFCRYHMCTYWIVCGFQFWKKNGGRFTMFSIPVCFCLFRNQVILKYYPTLPGPGILPHEICVMKYTIIPA